MDLLIPDEYKYTHTVAFSAFVSICNVCMGVQHTGCGFACESGQGGIGIIRLDTLG